MLLVARGKHSKFGIISPFSCHAWFCALVPISLVYLRKPIRDNPKIFTKSEKIFQIVMFFRNHRWRVYQILKTITNLNKIIESTNIILQIPNKLANPRIVASRKIFCKSEKIFCHVLLAPAVSQRRRLFPPFCRIQNGGGAVVGKDSLESL